METQLLDLGTEPLFKLLESLDIRSICALSQACKALYELSHADFIWREKALSLYPEVTVSLDVYGSYKELVRDGNKCHATVTVDLTGRICHYRNNRPDNFSQCRLTAIEWLRRDGCLRLYFDARGESDMRHPMTSSISLLAWFDAEAAEGTRSRLRGDGYVPEGWLNRAQTDSERALGWHLLVEKQGHMMGCLDFPLKPLSTALTSCERYCGDMGTTVSFCYANTAPTCIFYGRVDYCSVALLTVLPGQSLEDALSKAGKLTAWGEPGKQLKKEVGEEAQRAAWAHVGQEVLERRGRPWLVM